MPQTILRSTSTLHLLDWSFGAAAMPKELRKRGKRHKRSSAENQTHVQEREVLDEGPSNGPSWIVPRADSSSKQFNPEAPFGYVDPELKAYFRTIDDQLKEWQQNRDYVEGEEDVDRNESASYSFLCALLLVGLNLAAHRQEDVFDGRSARNIWQGV